MSRSNASASSLLRMVTTLTRRRRRRSRSPVRASFFRGIELGEEGPTRRQVMNVVTLRGRLARPAADRQLPSGDRLLGLELTMDGPEGKAETVPVVWFGAPTSAASLDADQEVVVVGRVRRRFFRAGQVTQS